MAKLCWAILGCAAVLPVMSDTTLAQTAASAPATPPAPAVPAPDAFIPDAYRPTAEFKAVLARAAPHLAALKEYDAPDFIPDVALETKGKDFNNRPGACKGKTVRATIRYLNAPTRITEYRGPLTDCQPSGIGVVREYGGLVWAGTVRGLTESKAPQLAIADGEGVLAKTGVIELGTMLGAPSPVPFVPTQAEAVNRMPLSRRSGAWAKWTGAEPTAVALMPSPSGGRSRLLLSSGAELVGQYDGQSWSSFESRISYPDLRVIVAPQVATNRKFVVGQRGGSPLVATSYIQINSTTSFGGLPAGTYGWGLNLLVGQRGRLRAAEQQIFEGGRLDRLRFSLTALGAVEIQDSH
jgi:hypothetical protein